MPQVSPDAPRRRKVSGSGAGQRWSCEVLCKIQDAKAVPEATVMGEVTRGNSPEKNGMKWMKWMKIWEKMGDFWAKSGLKRHSDYGLVLQIALEKDRKGT